MPRGGPSVCCPGLRCLGVLGGASGLVRLVTVTNLAWFVHAFAAGS